MLVPASAVWGGQARCEGVGPLAGAGIAVGGWTSPGGGAGQQAARPGSVCQAGVENLSLGTADFPAETFLGLDC